PPNFAELTSASGCPRFLRSGRCLGRQPTPPTQHDSSVMPSGGSSGRIFTSADLLGSHHPRLALKRIRSYLFPSQPCKLPTVRTTVSVAGRLYIALPPTYTQN